MQTNWRDTGAKTYSTICGKRRLWVCSNGRCDYHRLLQKARTRFKGPRESLRHQERIEGPTATPGSRWALGSDRPPLISCPLRSSGGDACGGERAANALHCPGIDAELFGNDAHTPGRMPSCSNTDEDEMTTLPLALSMMANNSCAPPRARWISPSCHRIPHRTQPIHSR